MSNVDMPCLLPLLPHPTSNVPFAAACLLFSCERLVKIYISHLSKQSDLTGDFQKLAELLVSLTITCGRLNNSLDKGMENVLHFGVRLSRIGDNNKTLKLAYMAELRRRMELEEVSSNTISQLGVFATMEIINK